MRERASMAIVALLGGCSGGDEPPWLDSKYAEIRLHDDASFCRGNVELDVDLHIEATAAALGLDEPRFTLEVYEQPPVPATGCGFFGCFTPPDSVRTTRFALRHELVHVVSFPLGAESAFLKEGLAEALTGIRTELFDDESIFEEAELPAPELSYSLAGHFVRWLIEEYGVAEVARVVSGADYEEVIGVDRDAVFADFHERAPWSYPGTESCTAPTLDLPDLGRTADFEVDGRCGAEGVRGHGLGNYVRHTLHVPQDSQLEIDVGPTVALRVVACQLGPLQEQPASEMLGDIRMEWRRGVHNGTLFNTDTSTTASFPAGSYEVRVEFPFGEPDEPGEFQVTRAD